MSDWERDREFSPAIGQEVSEEIYWEMLNCVPPTYNGRNLMQVGEPYSTDKETRKHLYTTFVRNESGKWVYVGHCLYGKTEDRPSLY